MQVLAVWGEVDVETDPDGVAEPLIAAFGPVPLSGGRSSETWGALRATVKEKLSRPAPAIDYRGLHRDSLPGAEG